MVPLASSPLSPPPPLVSPRSRRACQRGEMQILMRPVRVLRICRSVARSQSPEWARRPRPARGRPARSRRGTEPETAGSPNARLRAIELSVFASAGSEHRRASKNHRSSCSCVGRRGCRPAPETLLDSDSSRGPGGAESRARTDQAGSARSSSAWRSRNMRKSAGSGRVTRYRNTYVRPSSPMPIGSLSVNRRTVCPASDENVSDGRSANGNSLRRS